ncbi:acyl carrier protein [Streptomyces sp. NPDC052676]|uniref:acyl carrier protein n=1 Tax=Streptomyces sp. NPDC052676 TaxID=3154953 RepID=UPI00343BCA9A
MKAPRRRGAQAPGPHGAEEAAPAGLPGAVSRPDAEAAAAGPHDGPGLRETAPPSEGTESLEALTRALVCRIGGHAPEQVRDDSRLHEDLGFDSIRVMELKARVEHELPRLGTLPVEELLAALRTVGDLVRYLRERHTALEGTR